MSSLFAGLKEKFADKLAEFKGSTTPVDPTDKHAHDLVEAATSDELIAPDWSLNFNVIDFVNSEVRHNTGRTLKAIKRSLAKPNTKVQLLSLTLLESCVKNCPVEFHGQLATSELWADVVKLAEDTSITRVDAEVRDKVLGMVEDFSRLQPGQFQTTYGSLLDRGVDFPIRAPNEAVPLLTPPAHVAGAGAPPATAAPVAAVATAGGDLPAAAAAAAPAEGATAAEVDPLAGVDEQDRAAIQAALAELEAEAQAAQEAARIAAEADAVERRQQRLLQQQQQAAAQLMMQQQQQQQQAAMEAEAALGLLAAAQTAEAAAAAQAATATATATATGAATAIATAGDLSIGGPVPATHEQQQQQQPHPADSGALGVQPQQQAEAEAGEGPEPVGERVANLLETANNTTLLLSEMLASVPDSEPLAVREPYVAEVADTCVRLRRKLERDLVTLSDEALLSSALSQHEELSRVLMRYDELLAAAEAVAPTVPRNAAAVALSHAAASRGAAVAGGVAPHAHPHPPPLQHPQQPGELYYGQAPAAGTETAGQKVAAVAAALKERFTGAFDKLMAAAAAARAPGSLPPSTVAPVAGAATAIGSMGPADIGGATPAGTGAGGAFTLLDDDDEEANEGTALITKRATQRDATAAAASLQPQLQLQQLLHEATAAAVQPPLPPPAAAAGPDLINFDDEAPPQAPAAAEPALPVSEQERQQQQPETAEPIVAIQVSQSGGLNDLLSGLTVHATTDSASAGVEGSPLPPPPPPVETVIRDGSGGDQLVEALDRLVSQSSVSASPVEAARQAVAELPAALQLQEPKEPQQ